MYIDASSWMDSVATEVIGYPLLTKPMSKLNLKNEQVNLDDNL